MAWYLVKHNKNLFTLPRHEDVWGSGGIFHAFLTTVPDGGEWSASRPDRFTPREEDAGAHWTYVHNEIENESVRSW